MDGSETLVVDGPDGAMYRCYHRPDVRAAEALREQSERIRDGAVADEHAWGRAVRDGLIATGVADRLWPVGQDAAFAGSFGTESVARALTRLRERIDADVQGCRASRAFAPGSALARPECSSGRPKVTTSISAPVATSQTPIV